MSERRDPIHPELRWLAKLLPRGIARPWTLPLLRRLQPSTTHNLGALELRVHELPETSATARHIAPRSSAPTPRPALLWIHGGGYITGHAAQDDALCARFAQRLNIAVFSVDYRLAPEHPWPAALDDCTATYDLIQREAAALNIDPSRVALGGLSAGGGLAAALALRLHDTARPAPRLQLLSYPMLDDRTVLNPPRDLDVRIWDATSNALGWRSYLGREPGAADVSDHMAPARRADLSGLPPTWLGVGSLDLFHDEDVLYAQRLQDAGVPTTLDVIPGAFHGFDIAAPWTSVSKTFFEAQVAALRDALL